MRPPRRLARAQVGQRTFEDALAAYLSQGESGVESLSQGVREAVRLALEEDQYGVDSFDLVKKIVTSLFGVGSSIKNPVAYHKKVVDRKSLEEIYGMPAGPQLVRKVYFIFPMSPEGQEAEYRSFLERHQLNHLENIITLKPPKMMKEAFLKRTAPREQSQERPTKRIKAEERECASGAHDHPFQIDRLDSFEEKWVVFIKENNDRDLDRREIKALMGLCQLEACSSLLMLKKA